MTTERDLNESVTRAILAAAEAAGRDYRMAGFPRPFTASPDRFNHIFRAGENLSLCNRLAAVHPDRLRPLELPQIDCQACVDIFCEAMRVDQTPGVVIHPPYLTYLIGFGEL